MATHDQMRTTTTMFHESVHCKNFSELRNDRGAWNLAASMNRPALGMNNNQFMSLFHEVLVHTSRLPTRPTRALRMVLGW
ncbi:hypothetical protein B7H18_02630 [Pseudomonas putida]|nr:hypothetical protein B7H18_02630 [Pseudomonas putida]